MPAAKKEEEKKKAKKEACEGLWAGLKKDNSTITQIRDLNEKWLP